jgi:hypothetical protein
MTRYNAIRAGDVFAFCKRRYYYQVRPQAEEESDGSEQAFRFCGFGNCGVAGVFATWVDIGIGTTRLQNGGRLLLQLTGPRQLAPSAATSR